MQARPVVLASLLAVAAFAAWGVARVDALQHSVGDLKSSLAALDTQLAQLAATASSTASLASESAAEASRRETVVAKSEVSSFRML